MGHLGLWLKTNRVISEMNKETTHVKGSRRIYSKAEYRARILSVHFLILLWDAFDLDFSDFFSNIASLGNSQ